MLIYNTLTKKKEEFIPQNPDHVTMYVCGPTVYDYFHIGNARSFIMADMIRRYLEYKGYNVRYAMNITDIDDRIIEKSIKSNIPAAEVAMEYTDAFLKDIAGLKIKKATLYPKATDHIEEITGLISRIERNGFAYNNDGNVFFNVEKFGDYGKLSGKKIEELEAGARIEVNKEKQNPLDFALWKKAKEGEPFWESPWGKGRPGWHIECSAMSMCHLGETIDIHAGGSDLIFPHHENEIAQSESANSKEFVRYWIHFGFLNIDNEKMSKSLGNFFTAREILEHYTAEVIKFLFCQSHYSGPLNFSDFILESAKKGQEKLNKAALTIEERLADAKESGRKPVLNFEKYYADFESAMDNDFNSPVAVSVIFEFIREINQILGDRSDLSVEFLGKAKEYLEKTAAGVLGILDFDALSSDNEKISDNHVKGLVDLLVDLRLSAKLERNFEQADDIRNFLAGLGIILEDGREGTKVRIQGEAKDLYAYLTGYISRLRNGYKDSKNYIKADLIRSELLKLGFKVSDGKSGTEISINN